MAQEEQNQRCSNSSSGGDGGSAGGGGRPSKKLKQKKVPQRGLGVAQLEKIRLGELQNEEASLSSSTSLISPRASNSSCLGVQRGINFRPNPSTLTPFLTPLPTSLSPPISSFGPSSNFLHPNTVLLPKPVSGFGPGNRSNGEYNLEGQKKHRLDHHGQPFGYNVDFPYEYITVWPPPDVMQRTQQFQHPSSSLMVNVSSSISSSFSVINYPLMEPPSSQSSYGNNFTPTWLEEEKSVGMKRLYNFTLGNPSVPSFPSKFSPTYVAPITRSDNNSASIGTGGTSYVEPRNPGFRDPTRSESNPKMVAGKTVDLSGDFLSLGATTAFPHSSFKYNDHSISQELSEFGSLPYKGSTKDPICHPEPSRSIQQQAFYSFFPPAKTPTAQEATTSSICSEKVGENVDLNLKL